MTLLERVTCPDEDNPAVECLFRRSVYRCKFAWRSDPHFGVAEVSSASGSSWLEELRQRHAASDLLVLLKHMLGDGEQVTLALQS